MMEIDSIKEYLEKQLSEKRYRHSLGVADEAVKLAEKYEADKFKAYVAGLTHDVAKEIENSEAKKLLKEYGVSIDLVSENTHKLLHGPLGACMAQDKFSIDDIEILDAIKYHTTGKANMSLLTKIIYIADYIEPNRDFEDVDKLRKLAYEDLDAAILLGINWTFEELMERYSMFHFDTVHARNYLIMQRKNGK